MFEFQESIPSKRVTFNPLANMYVRRHHGYLVIPHNVTWAGVGLDNNGGEPVYWKLSEIMGDKVMLPLHNTMNQAL